MAKTQIQVQTAAMKDKAARTSAKLEAAFGQPEVPQMADGGQVDGYPRRGLTDAQRAELVPQPSLAPVEVRPIKPEPFESSTFGVGMADGGMAEAIKGMQGKREAAIESAVNGPAPAAPTPPPAPAPAAPAAPAAPMPSSWTRLKHVIFGHADGGMVCPHGKSHGKCADCYAAGGAVQGPGGPTEDKIPAMLSNGEYVLPADTVQKLGKHNLDAIKAATHTPVKAQFGMADGGYTVDELPAEEIDYAKTPNPSLRSPAARNNFNVKPGTPSPEAAAYNARFGSAAPAAPAPAGAAPGVAPAAAQAAPAAAGEAAGGAAGDASLGGKATQMYNRAADAVGNVAKRTFGGLGSTVRAAGTVLRSVGPLAAGGLAANSMAENGVTPSNAMLAAGGAMMAVPGLGIPGAAVAAASPLADPYAHNFLQGGGGDPTPTAFDENDLLRTNAAGASGPRERVLGMDVSGNSSPTATTAPSRAIFGSPASTGHFSDARYDAQHGVPGTQSVDPDAAAGITPEQRAFFGRAGVDSSWQNKGDFGSDGTTVFRKGNSYVGAGGGTNKATGYAPKGVDFGFKPGEVEAYKASLAAGPNNGMPEPPGYYQSPEAQKLRGEVADLAAKLPKPGQVGFNRASRTLAAKQSALSALEAPDNAINAHNAQNFAQRSALFGHTLAYNSQAATNELGRRVADQNYQIKRAEVGNEAHKQLVSEAQQRLGNSNDRITSLAKADGGDPELYKVAAATRMFPDSHGKQVLYQDLDEKSRAKADGFIQLQASKMAARKNAGLPYSLGDAQTNEDPGFAGWVHSFISAPGDTIKFGATQTGSWRTGRPNTYASDEASAADAAQRKARQ